MDINMVNIGNSTYFTNTTSTSSECPSFTQNTLITVLNTVNWTLALPSVSWALWLLIRGPRISLETEFVVLNLLCVDMACVLLGIGSYFNEALLHSQVLDICGEFIYLLCLYGNPMIQCCMYVERYLAVVHPVPFLKYRQVRNKVAALSLVWLLTIALGFVHHFIHSSYVLLGTLLPVSCIAVFCSLSILRVLRNTLPGDEFKKMERQKSNLIKKKAFGIVVFLQIKQLVNYMPYVILTMIKDLFPKILYNCYLFSTAICICFFGNFIQSFLYLQRTGRLSFIPGL